MRYVRLDEALRLAGLPRELVDELLDLHFLHPKPTLDAERVISVDELDELRVARRLLDDLGVNPEGVEVILHMRRRQIALQRELDELVLALKDELRERLRDPGLLGPRAFLTGS
jgi:hypothetical protein